MTSRLDQVTTTVGTAGLRRWGDAPPQVVLVHGAGGNRDSLAPLGDALADRGLAVAAVSLPGRDASGSPPAGSVGEAAEWLAAVLAALAPDGTVLAGHSMGGAVAIETVLSTDAAITGLVLLATGARLRVHPDILARAAEEVEEGRTLLAVTTAALRPDTPSALRGQVRAASVRTPGATGLADWRMTDRFDRLGDVGALHLPVLAVAGEDDGHTPPKYAQFVAEHAPDAQSVVLPAAGHWLPVERATEVADLVAVFHRRVAPASAGSRTGLLVRAQRRGEWSSVREVPPDPGTEPPFVHLSTPRQVAGVCERRFAGVDDLVLLVVDPSRLPAPVVWEDLEGEGQVFPHLYGPLPADAVVDVVEYRPGPDGRFEEPMT